MNEHFINLKKRQLFFEYKKHNQQTVIYFFINMNTKKPV